MADSLSMAFLLLLESLSPVERAVFLLHDVFDYGYDEIAAVVDKSEANCRQIAVRARRQIEAKKPRFEASRRARNELSQRFFEAVRDGDVDALVRMLAADVVAYGDGGGRALAFPHPVHGRERVARLVLGGRSQGQRRGVVEMRFVEVNGQPGALFLGQEGEPLVVVSIDIADGQIQALRAISNPEKLRHLARGSTPR